MASFTSLLVISFVLLSSSAFTHAQSNQATQTPTPKSRSPKDKPARNTDPDRTAREQRALALSLLISLANEARSFRDQALRARTLARIADALWEIDAEQGGALFRRAWDAAEIADKESQQRLEEELRQQRSVTGGAVAFSLPPNLRGEVLRLAARRDYALGDELLEKLKADKQQEAANSSKIPRPNSFGLSEALSQRLSLAQQLLEVGDVERATQFAEPALGAVSVASLNFLTNLRDKNPTTADRFYVSLLANARGSLQSDANTVSLLSSYLFTPHLFVTFNSRGGASISQTAMLLPPPNVPPDLRGAFFRMATEILMRPMPPPGQDQGTVGTEGKYQVLRRLLPLFEQYAPRETTESVQAQMDVLSSTVRESVRQQDDEWVRRGISPEKQSEGREQSLLDRIDRAKTSQERDDLYLQLALQAGAKGDMRARDFVDKIDDTGLRQQARAYIDASLAIHAIEKKEAERALEIARTGELSPIQRVWVLTRASKLLLESDREKALDLLDKAAVEARRIEVSDPDRARAFLAIANALVKAERARAWETVLDAAKAANSAKSFTGEDGKLILRLQTKGSGAIRDSSVPEFDLAGIFRALALENYERAIELARSFENEAPKATAIITIARSVFSDDKN